MRKVSQDEIPSTIPLKSRTARGTLWTIPPGLDPLEIGLIQSAGRFELLPIDVGDKPLWGEVTHLVVTDNEARRQRDILFGYYDAMLRILPDDAADVDISVREVQDSGETHPIFQLLRQAALETWIDNRKGTGPLTEAQREKLNMSVARRATAMMRKMSPACRLDRASFRALQEIQYGVLWDRIAASIAAGKYEDATMRALARLALGRNLVLPIRRVLELLPRVSRLDIFFALILRSTVPAGETLTAALLAEVARTDTKLNADQMLSILYVLWRTAPAEHVHPALLPWLRRHADTKITNLGAGMLWWLATQAGLDCTQILGVITPSSAKMLRDAITLVELEFKGSSIVEILQSLPERVS